MGAGPAQPRHAAGGQSIASARRDFAAVEGNGKLTIADHQVGARIGRDRSKGLDEQDRTFLRTMIEVYGGGPVGIEAIAATMGEERDTLEDVIEPFLLQNALRHADAPGPAATKAAL